MRQLFKMHPSIYITLFTFICHVESNYLSKKDRHVEHAGRKLPINNTVISNLSRFMIYQKSGNSKELLVHNLSTKQEPCTLQVNDKSQNKFARNILKYRFNFVYLKLNFVNFSVNGTEMVITKTDWIWTYKGENGAHQYLYLPRDFGYLSFGLLWAHTLRKQIPINIKKTGNCSNLTIGLQDTDLLIGQALGSMTAKLASHNDIYNSSYWCYNKRTWVSSNLIYRACGNWICTLQTIEYSCCKYVIDYTEKIRTVKCGTEHYKFGTLFHWILSTLIGELCFAFYPLLLTKIGMKVNSVSKRVQKERKKTLSMHDYSDSTHLNRNYKEENNKYLFISLKGSNPVTVLSTLLSPLHGLDLDGPIISRALKIWIVIIPMSLSAIHVVFDYIYAKDFVTDAVMKGALVGFSSIIAGPDEARKHFLYLFGGPVVAMTIYISFGFLLIAIPSNLGDFIESGLPSCVKKFTFLARMPLKLKERLSGISVRHHNGYEKLHRFFLAQIFMILNRHFWGYSIKMFYLRWKNIIFPTMAHKLRSMFAAFVLSFLCLPLYIIFCLIELVLAFVYYVFPVINCFFIVLKSFLIHYTIFFQDRGCIMKCLKYFLFLPMLISFCMCWYMYCILFFDGFWFLSKIAIFMYAGIIAYPKRSYGYLVLAFMAIYYLIESVNAFGENYRELLKLSLETCENFQQKHLDENNTNQAEIKAIRTKYGMKSDLFYMIVDRHLPRRNQVLITVLKFTSVITVLTISVWLLVAFDKFQDLSLISHVFTVLFICALPKIIKLMCLQNHRHKTRRKMRSKIFRLVSDYVRNQNRNNRSTDAGEDDILVSRNSGYEILLDTDSVDESDDK